MADKEQAQPTAPARPRPAQAEPERAGGPLEVIPKAPPIAPHFPKIREAKEAMQRKAEKWANDYDKLITRAVTDGDAKNGGKLIQWAFEHIEDDKGEKVAGRGVDRQLSGDATPALPTIQIGFALGGLPKPPELPPPTTVIEVKPEDVKDVK